MADDLRHELEKWLAASRHEDPPVTGERKNGRIQIRGRRLIDFTSWDFFNLNQDSKLKRAAQSEIELSGVGAVSHRFCSGTYPAHVSCEKRLAEFLNAQAALLFSSKNQAVLSLVTALVTEKDYVFGPELIQSPVFDACYLAGAHPVFFDSENPASLESELQKTPSGARKFVFIESVSPLHGTTPDFAGMADMLEKQGCYLCLDESFALGTVGPRGAGIFDFSPLGPKPLCQYGDLSLGIGCYGAFIAGEKSLTAHISHRSRTLGSEIALPQHLAAGIEKSINLVESRMLEREKMRILAFRLKKGLFSMGYASGEAASPLVCVSFPKLSVGREIAEALIQKGFFAEVVPSATFLKDQAVLRFILNTAHTEQQIDSLLEALSEIRQHIESL